MNRGVLYGGLAKVNCDFDEFEIGDGIIIRQTFAHLFSPFMMAFKPKGKEGFNEGPWKAAKGGIAFDITAEIEVPDISEFKDKFNQEDIVWLIASLIRLSRHPYAIAPALSDISFKKIIGNDVEPTIRPFEVKHRIFGPTKDGISLLEADTLYWIKDIWKSTARLLISNPQFNSAYRAFDFATIENKTSSSLLSIWGAIEQLFSPGTGELKFRVSSYLACYLSDPGEKRIKLYKELTKLYNERSSAAHTAKEADNLALIGSFVHLRNALVKIIDTGKIPSVEMLEELLFSGAVTDKMKE